MNEFYTIGDNLGTITLVIVVFYGVGLLLALLQGEDEE